MSWWQTAINPPYSSSAESALQRQAQLTKPAGSLGRLEQLAVLMAGFQGSELPVLDNILIRVFAADHGAAALGISAFPQSVTEQMIYNFSAGGAAITVLARRWEADFAVVNTGTLGPMPELPRVVSRSIGSGTANFCEAPAMTDAQVQAALDVGAEQIDGAWHLFIAGEMGIGNTSSAAALASCMLGVEPGELVGPGTGVDESGLRRKRQVIESALALHQASCDTPLETLRRLGGFEIAAMCGAYIRSAQCGTPALVDGYISSVAALLACAMNPGVRDWLVFSHRSAEPGHAKVLAAMQAEPLLSLGMRLGEGSGAAVALALISDACLLHRDMATFAEAGVSEGQSQ